MGQIIEFAPAKINLSLQVTGRRDDGYHLLKSLVVFASVGDRVFLEPSSDFSLKVTGPFGAFLSKNDNQEDNLVIKTGRKLQKFLGTDQGATITLEKNLPVASGIGGGSSDAAAALRGLMRLWHEVPQNISGLRDLALEVGADVPVCLESACSWMEGVGEVVESGPGLPDLYGVLINPGYPVSTPEIFKELKGGFSQVISERRRELSMSDLLSYLNASGNDLTKPASRLAPVILDCINALRANTGCLFAGMSGSGATCFGLYETFDAAKKASGEIANARKEWWVQPVTLY
ncbi:hypothetical protein WH95_04675 [Kiloniella litopenaei]|uniref:4-diphosphocytidyl-2-C-methyl-D-erythritol kinase n=1 Tax=Kiloniella litopenaei TaxID=1549748 RepID=A0A0M2RBF6_9PROT|nr:4-(cytidine 5'-diphospho)-2-C-methyl-D-erythritol kinase [Kiloniella litopenaei]KKJ77744.1 hypothetical protein WH95_04675 [Kiloniella litopenaei]